MCRPPTGGIASPMRPSPSTPRPAHGQGHGWSCSARRSIAPIAQPRRRRSARVTTQARTCGGGYRPPRWHRRPARLDGSAGDWWRGTTKATPRTTRPPRTAGRPRPRTRSASASAIRRASSPRRACLRGSAARRRRSAPQPGSWSLASGGVTDPTVQYGGTRLKQYQTASLAPAGAVIAIAATGVVVRHGSPCFGCKHSPVTYWAYRDQPAPSIDRSPPVRQSASLHLAAGHRTRASESATPDSATRSRSAQPGPEAR